MLISVLSVSDAPGCTTASVAMATNWPRPVVLIEADTSHASSILPGYFKGEHPQTFGVLDLAAMHRARELGEDTIFANALELGAAERWVVPGFSGPAPAQSAAASWPALADLFTRLEQSGVDVIADLGRLGPADHRTPLLTKADAVMVSATADLAGLYGLRARLPELHGLMSTDSDAARLGVVLREHPAAVQGYSAREVRSALSVATWGTISWDPAGAAVYSHGVPKSSRALARRPFERSIAALGTTIRETITARRSEIGLMEGSKA